MNCLNCSSWTAKEVKSSGQRLSAPWLSTSMGLCSCGGKTAKGLQLVSVLCLWVTAEPDWEAVFQTFASKNNIAFLINQDQFTELSCTFSTGHDQEVCFHLSPTFSYQRRHFSSSPSLSVTWASCYHLSSVQPPGAELKQHLFSLERVAAEATLKKIVSEVLEAKGQHLI